MNKQEETKSKSIDKIKRNLFFISDLNMKSQNWSLI